MRFSRFVMLGVLLPSSNAMKGIQTGPLSGSAYAAHMLYDPGTATVFMVGNTYDQNIASGSQEVQVASESSCFITSLDLDYFEDGWENTLSIGDSNILETCHGLGMINPTALLVLGNSEPGGLFSTNDSKMTGFAMALDKTDFDVSSGLAISTSASSRITYPISVATDGVSDMYVVSLTSTDDEFSSSSGRAIASAFPNWIGNEKYGTSFEMSVAKVSFQENLVLGVPDGPSTLTLEWMQEFPVNPESNGFLPRVYLAGIILKNDSFLVVAGSTRGLGDVYGAAQGDDEDGFITLLDPSTGELLQGQKNQERIGSAEDDVITGICDNPNDPNSFYIVGGTRGDIDGIQDDQLPTVQGSLQPFIKKISVSTLHAIWTVQWGSVKGNEETSAFALGCAVSGDTVYVAGNVENGAGMIQGNEMKESKGDDDIWVVQLTDYGSDYRVNWLQQIGTPGDDHLARYGGIVTDNDGNAVLYGDTTGSMFREKGGSEDSSVTDVFMMILGKYNTAPVAPVAPPATAPVATPVSSPYGIEGFEGSQSGRSTGNAYASSMMYDISTDTVFLVGNTYDPTFGTYTYGLDDATSQSNCFVARVSLIGSSGFRGSRVLDDDADALESCRGIGFMTGKSLVLLGNSEPGGMFADENKRMTGFVAALEKNSLQRFAPLPFSMSDSNKIPYPIASVSDGVSSLYVIALSSTDSKISSQYGEAVSNPYPNWIEYEKYGTSFDMTVMKVSFSVSETTAVSDGHMSLSQEWKHEFAVEPESNGGIPRVFLGGLIIKNGSFLIAAGSTRGLGDGYGSAEGDDEDGFVTLLDLEDGNLLQGRKNQERLGSDKDDIVTAICDNPIDPDSFYVVGATKGDIGGIQGDELTIKENSLQAFVMKLDVNTLHAIWTKQWGSIRNGSETSAYALGCAVSGETVYVAGNVENGAGMVQGYDMQESKGGDDIWVAQLTDYGHQYEVNWIHQVGTSGDDRLAPNGGIVVDRNENAIIFGQTPGSIFRERVNGDDNQSDVFIMSFKHQTGTHATQQIDDADNYGQSDPADTFIDSGDYDDTDSPSDNIDIEYTEKSSDSAIVTLSIIALILLVFSVFFCWYSKQREHAREEALKASTFSYLQPFDVEDIDLRRSPPGGYHGTYMNKLAYGINRCEMGPSEEDEDDDNLVDIPATISFDEDSSYMDRASLFSSKRSQPRLGPVEDMSEYSSFEEREVVNQGRDII